MSALHVHVDRLIIDGGDLSAADARALAAAFTAAVGEALARCDTAPSPGHVDAARAAPVDTADWRTPAALGAAAARSLAASVVAR